MCVCNFLTLRLYLFVFRSVFHVYFSTCMLHKVYVLGVRMFFIVFAMLAEILSSAEN